MAETSIYYVKPGNHSKPDLSLCFACAVKEVVAGAGDNIYITSTDYKFEQCAICKNFIYDKVTI